VKKGWFLVLILVFLVACVSEGEDGGFARDAEAGFSSTWARNSTHFFFLPHSGAIYRLPFGNIERGEAVLFSADGEIEIVGISENYLFISFRSGDWEARNYATYRLSLEEFEPELLDSGIYYGLPRLHAAGASILFTHANVDEGRVWIEALSLETGARRIIYEFDSQNFTSFNTGWWQMENNAVAFINSSWGGAEGGSDFIFIDSQLRARRIQLDEIENLPHGNRN
jgi:hypothetical protein